MKIRFASFFFFVVLFCSISRAQQNEVKTYLKILGTLQDGGSPHIGCQKKCCNTLTLQDKEKRKVTALEIAQPSLNQSLLFEATPDIVSQWTALTGSPKGIFLTHAHMGHYSGLLHLGREALGAQKLPVYVLPKMKQFLQNNAPWSQLVELKNILLKDLEERKTLTLLKNVHVTPLRVPHRDEFSETVGFLIEGPQKKALFIPDIDKWTLWEENLVEWLNRVDYAFLDATFYNSEEVNYRPLSEIPH
ncbi:MAG: MBL fold metallo-hydrolase, partial [Flavobacteriaceae bacterium]